MKLTFPLRRIFQNMMYTADNEVWAYYRIKPVNVTVTNDKEKEKSKRNIQHLLSELKQYKDVDLFMVPQDMTLAERFKELSEDFSPDTRHIAIHFANETIKRLTKDMGMIYDYDWVVGVPLKSSMTAESVGDGVKKAFEQTRNSLLGLAGYEVDITDNDFEAYLPLEDVTMRKFGIVQGDKLSEDDMYYLNRLNFIRNMPHTLEGQRVNQTLDTITDGIIDPSHRIGMLKLNSMEGESYIATLPIADTPLNMAFMHTGEIVQNLPFPVELRFKLQFQEIKGSVGIEGKANRNALRLKNLVKESRSVGNNESREVASSRIVVEDLKAKIEAEQPIVNWLGMIVIYAKTEKECRNRVNAVVSTFKARKIKLSKAQSQQVYLFYKNLMGEGLKGSDKKWLQTSSVEGFAENLLGISQSVGYKLGWYFGRVDGNISPAKNLPTAIRGSHKIVQINPYSANKYNEGMRSASPHWAITGETGQGKTVASSLLFTFLGLMKGRGLFIDPKSEKRPRYEAFLNDKRNWEKYPAYCEYISTFHYVTFDPDEEENWGVLDPIVFLTGSDAKDTAEAMVVQIMPVDKYLKAHKVLLRSIREVMDRREAGEQVGMLHVVELMRNSTQEEVKDVGDLLYEKVQDSILRLGFSNGENTGVTFDKRLTILGVKGLTLPRQGKESSSFSEAEKRSICLMMPLGKFCELFGSRNDKEETFEVLEEAWVFNTSSEGKAIVNSIKRVGRSQNNVLVYSTQSVNDVDSEDDHGNFGTVLAFNEPKEQDLILRHVGVEDTPRNRKWLDDMHKGQCLMLDPYKRVQKISIHCLFPEIMKTFETVDDTASSKAEQKFR